MATKLRLALLICDTPIPNVLQHEGDYYKVYGNYLQRSLDVYQKDNKEKIEYQLDGYDVRFKEEYPNLDNYDGIVITGSGESSHGCMAPTSIS
jgi:hypothetical protein